MIVTTSEILVEWKPATAKAKVIVSVSRNGETIACDELKIHSSKEREALQRRLVELGCCSEDVQAELLAIARDFDPAEKASSNLQPDDEIDACMVYRPERILAPDMSAISIPILSASVDGVSGSWYAYCVSEAGRERVRLSPVLNVVGERYYLENMPPAPTVSDAAGWSRESRRRWLSGAGDIDPADLFKHLMQAMDHYIEFAPEKRHGYLAILVCWIVLTYVYHAWKAVPYLLVNGPAASGKSTIFSLLKLLAFRPMATDNVSAAAVFRTLHNYGGTLLFDEAERLRDTKAPDVADINSMLLAGYQRGRGATRLEKVGDSFKTVNYNVYGPKAIACINGVLSALQTRCIEIRTQRAAADSPKPKRSLDETNWQELRDGLHVLAINNGATWIYGATRRDIGSKLNGRDFELWQPLLSVASFFEEAGIADLLSLMESTALQSTQDAVELKTPEADECILSVLAEAIREGVRIRGRSALIYQPTSAEILEVCREKSEATFRTFSPQGIGHRLRAYGLSTVKSGSRREYRTQAEKLREIQERYSIDLGI